MKAAASIEHVGVPIDTQILSELQKNWGAIQDHLISEIDVTYKVYEGRSFKVAKFAEYSRNREIPWPIFLSGRLDLKDDTFREMARPHPEIAPLRELRVSMSPMQRSKLAVGEWLQRGTGSPRYRP